MQNLFHIHQKAIDPTGPGFPGRVTGVLMPVKREYDNDQDEYRRADGKGSAHVKVVRGHSCAADSSPILKKIDHAMAGPAKFAAMLKI